MHEITSFSKLVNKLIKKRFKSYIFLIIAIILAVFFSSSLVLVASSTYSSIIDLNLTQYGRHDIILSYENIDELVRIGAISEYGTTEAIGYVMPDRENIKNGFTIAKYDDEYVYISNKKLIGGNFPQDKGEIAIEKTMLNRLRQDVNIGDKITLTIAIPDGTGFLDNVVTKNYILTGILEDQYIYFMRYRDSNPVYGDIPAALVSNAQEIEAGGMYIIKQYGLFDDVRTSFEILNDLNKDKTSDFYNLYNDNNTILYFSAHGLEDVLMNPDSYQLLTSAILISILAVVLVFMFGFTIVSAFYANIDQRAHQIGLLRVVGATKKQIKAILMQEIIIISIISIPIGILLSIFSVKALSHFLGDIFILNINIIVIFIIVVLAFICVLLAALLPLKRASEIPPMQIIRDSHLSLNLIRRRVRTEKMYNVERHLAKRKTILYKNNLMTLTVLITLTIIILAFAIGFGPFYMDSYSENNYDYDFSIQVINLFTMEKIITYNYHSPGISEADKQEAQNIIGDGVIYTNRSVTVNFECEIDDYVLSTIGYHTMQNPESHYYSRYENYKNYFGFKNDFVTADVIGTDDVLIEGLVPYVYEGQINMDKINSGEEIVLIVPKKCGVISKESNTYSVHRIMQEGVNYDAVYENDVLHAGDTIDITLLYTDNSGNDLYSYDMDETMVTEFEKKYNTVKIGALVQLDASSNFPFISFQPIQLLTTQGGFDKLGYYSPYHSLYTRLNYIPDDSEISYIEQQLSEIASLTDNAMFTSFISITESKKQMVSNVIAVVFTLFTLFVILSVAMINNSISARIHSSKVMIGTMRAVGANKSVIKKIFGYQLIDMVRNGTIIGVTIYVVLFVVISRSNPILTDVIQFIKSLVYIVIYIAILFSVCYSNVHRKTRVYLKRSIVENIREL